MVRTGRIANCVSDLSCIVFGVKMKGVLSVVSSVLVTIHGIVLSALRVLDMKYVSPVRLMIVAFAAVKAPEIALLAGVSPYPNMAVWKSDNWLQEGIYHLLMLSFEEMVLFVMNVR